MAKVALVRESTWPSEAKPKSQAVRLASSDMPMLVGDVRWATTMTGCSCMLSGGSQLSAVPTKSSKNPQVLRASACKNSASASLSSAPLRAIGRLIHQAMTGAINHSSSTGAAANSAPGLANQSISAAPTASAGENHMRRQLAPASVDERARLDGRHSSRLRRVTSRR